MNMKQKTLFSKRSVLLAALVVILGLAVYLNWYLSSPAEGQSVTDVLSGSTMGQAVYVNAEASAEASQEDDYFTQTRTQRQQAREEAVDSLKEIINNVKSDSSAVADATARSNQIASNIEAESNMESLIRAKGFADCVVVMGEGNVSVVVKTDGLLASDTVQIQEILEQNSGFSLENIKIIEVK
jgi:stage III sporulation protein AH